MGSVLRLDQGVCFAFAIALTSCHYGLAVRGGAVGVGRAVNDAVVAAAFSHHDLRLPAHVGAAMSEQTAPRPPLQHGLVLLRFLIIAAVAARRLCAAVGPGGAAARSLVARASYGGSSITLGNRSLVCSSLTTLGFIGMVLVFQTCPADQPRDRRSVAGRRRVRQDPGPRIRTLADRHDVGHRVGAGIAAEIGSMVVTEQVDALRMCGVEPVEYLLSPASPPCCL